MSYYVLLFTFKTFETTFTWSTCCNNYGAVLNVWSCLFHRGWPWLKYLEQFISLEINKHRCTHTYTKNTFQDDFVFWKTQLKIFLPIILLLYYAFYFYSILFIYIFILLFSHLLQYSKIFSDYIIKIFGHLQIRLVLNIFLQLVYFLLNIWR